MFITFDVHSESASHMQVPGVTAIATDIHKYGATTKGLDSLCQYPCPRMYLRQGCSVVTYSTKEMVHYQYSVVLDWPGMDLEQHT